MSELFTKNSPFSTHIPDIDAEHAQLHIEAKRIAALFTSGTDVATILLDLVEFIELVEAHFRHEETFFDRLTPKQAEAHRKEHAMLTLSLRLFAESISDRDGIENWTSFIDLEDILFKHIILFDLDLRD